MPERNVALLEQTMQHILDHPEKHKQSYWFTQTECGTAACFAGWACLLSGYEVNWSSEDVYETSAGIRRTSSITGDGEESDAIGGAQRLLGLTWSESQTLFFSANTREQLQLMVKDLVNGDDLRQGYEYKYLQEVHLA